MLSNRQHLILGGGLAELTPRFFLLPHVFYLIRECYEVVPDDYRECRKVKALEYAQVKQENPRCIAIQTLIVSLSNGGVN